MTILAVAAGFAADLAFGDPRWLPHPVVAMGRAITWVEGRLRGAFPQTSAGTRAAGLVLAVALPLACGLLTWGILQLCGMVHPGLRFVVEAWASYQILAACELRRQSLAVARAFSKGGLVAAREAVGLIVGRDTSVLDEQGVARAAVETVAENASDGVIAPLFYLMIGGVPLGIRLRLGAPRRCGELDSLALIGPADDRRVPDRRARRARGGAHLAPRQASPCEPERGADRVSVRGRARAAPGRTRGVFRQAR